MTGMDKDIFRAIRSLTSLLNEACSHWNYLCPYLAKLGGAADRALEGYARDYPEDVKALIAERPAPPRNCEVGTPDEQAKRWRAFCDQFDDDCTGCPCDDAACASYTECFARWAQTPYAAEV